MRSLGVYDNQLAREFMNEFAGVKNKSSSGAVHTMQRRFRSYMPVISWRLIAVSTVVIAACIYIAQPHRFESFQIDSTLQNGMKMSARVTVCSPWGWATPDRACAITVTLNGKNIVVAPTSYRGVHPLDIKRKAAIAEKGGYPELIMWGAAKSEINNVRWYFQNYSFSEVDVVGQHQQKVTYFGTPAPEAKEGQLAVNAPGKPLFVITSDSIHRAPRKDNQ